MVYCTLALHPPILGNWETTNPLCLQEIMMQLQILRNVWGRLDITGEQASKRSVANSLGRNQEVQSTAVIIFFKWNLRKF